MSSGLPYLKAKASAAGGVLSQRGEGRKRAALVTQPLLNGQDSNFEDHVLEWNIYQP